MVIQQFLDLEILSRRMFSSSASYSSSSVDRVADTISVLKNLQWTVALHPGNLQGGGLQWEQRELLFGDGLRGGEYHETGRCRNQSSHDTRREPSPHEESHAVPEGYQG